MSRYVTYNISDKIITNKTVGDYSSPFAVYHDPQLQVVLEVNDAYKFDTLKIYGSRVINDEIIEIPERPGQSYIWDTVNDTWKDTTLISELKKLKLLEIDAEREKRNNLPIQYANTLFDANQLSQRNISAWMTNINANVTLPSNFAWRDFYNIDHPADAAFVIGLGNAITLRGTQIYQKSWIKKAEVEALTTTESVKAYDVTANWD